MNTFPSLLRLLARHTTVPVLRSRIIVPVTARSLSISAPHAPFVPKPIPFAVEGPDGSSEALRDAELHEVEDIIDHAAKFEDASFVQQLHDQQHDATRTFAVDAPDGEADDIHQEDLHAVEEVISYAAEHEDKEDIILSHKMEEAAVKARTGRRVPDYSQIPKS
eukprot:scaffold1697_cov180-Amphora_coffeaeformis.AAC.14